MNNSYYQEDLKNYHKNNTNITWVAIALVFLVLFPLYLTLYLASSVLIYILLMSIFYTPAVVWYVDIKYLNMITFWNKTEMFKMNHEFAGIIYICCVLVSFVLASILMYHVIIKSIKSVIYLFSKTLETRRYLKVENQRMQEYIDSLKRDTREMEREAKVICSNHRALFDSDIVENYSGFFQSFKTLNNKLGFTNDYPKFVESVDTMLNFNTRITREIFETYRKSGVADQSKTVQELFEIGKKRARQNAIDRLNNIRRVRRQQREWDDPQ